MQQIRAEKRGAGQGRGAACCVERLSETTGLIEACSGRGSGMSSGRGVRSVAVQTRNAVAHRSIVNAAGTSPKYSAKSYRIRALMT